MAKARSRKSSGQSREQQRESQNNQQQSRGRVAAARQQRLEGRQRNQRKRTTSNTKPWIWVGGVVLVVVVIVGIFIYLSRQSAGGSSTINPGSAKPTPASSAVLQKVTHVDPSVASAIGGVGTTPPTRVNGKPLLTGNAGKPIFFYDGAEYCPYCAAERWGVVVALSRFGTFSKLNTTTSSATDVYPNTHTFTFYQSSYQSSYIDFLSVEETTNQPDGNGGYTPLQTPTQQEQDILNALNQQGGIPFIDIANKFTVVSAAYDPQVLQNMSWDEIANNLSNANSPVTKGIVGTANYLTAAICMTTNQQPASACSAAPIQQLEQSLGKAAVGTSGMQVGYSEYSFEANVRREGLAVGV